MSSSNIRLNACTINGNCIYSGNSEARMTTGKYDEYFVKEPLGRKEGFFPKVKKKIGNFCSNMCVKARYPYLT